MWSNDKKAWFLRVDRGLILEIILPNHSGECFIFFEIDKLIFFLGTNNLWGHFFWELFPTFPHEWGAIFDPVGVGK